MDNVVAGLGIVVALIGLALVISLGNISNQLGRIIDVLNRGIMKEK